MSVIPRLAEAGGRPPLARAVGLVVLFWFAVFDVLSLVEFYLRDFRKQDFSNGYAAARIGLARGWPHLYDVGLQVVSIQALRPDIPTGFDDRFINPPPLALLIAPLTVLPLPVAYAVWSLIGIGSLLLAWHLATRPGAWKPAHLLGAIAFFPVLFAIQLGQPTPLVLLGVTGAWWFLRREQPVAAGLALSLMALKPQVALLVPPALLIAGQRRAFLSWLGATSVLGAVSLALIGAYGLEEFLAQLQFQSQLPFNRYLTIGWALPGPGLGLIAEVACMVISLGAAFWQRHHLDRVFMVSVAGSVVAATYLHWPDLIMLLLPAWLLLRRETSGFERAALLAVAVCGELVWVITPLPWILAGVGWVIVLAVSGRGSWLRLRPAPVPG